MKYRLTDETKTNEYGIVLHMICALRDIPSWGVRRGDLGGWVEKEVNLSQDGDAWISDNAVVFGDAQVRGDACVGVNAVVSGDSYVSGCAEVDGNARVDENTFVGGNSWVGGNARVFGCAQVRGNAQVSGDAVVLSSADYLVFKNSWSSYRWFTYTRSNKMWKAGCFYGTGEELIKKAYADSDKSGRCYEAIVRAVEAIESATEKEEGGAK